MKMISGFMFNKRIHTELIDNINYFSQNYKFLFLLNIKVSSGSYEKFIFLAMYRVICRAIPCDTKNVRNLQFLQYF
jgi:hypothetical protein